MRLYDLRVRPAAAVDADADDGGGGLALRGFFGLGRGRLAGGLGGGGGGGGGSGSNGIKMVDLSACGAASDVVFDPLDGRLFALGCDDPWCISYILSRPSLVPALRERGEKQWDGFERQGGVSERACAGQNAALAGCGCTTCACRRATASLLLLLLLRLLLPPPARRLLRRR